MQARKALRYSFMYAERKQNSYRNNEQKEFHSSTSWEKTLVTGKRRTTLILTFRCDTSRV